MSHSQFHCTGRVYLDMHGLIFETSICYWQDQPGSGTEISLRLAARQPPNARPPARTHHPPQIGAGRLGSRGDRLRREQRPSVCGAGQAGRGFSPFPSTPPAISTAASGHTQPRAAAATSHHRAAAAPRNGDRCCCRGANSREDGRAVDREQDRGESPTPATRVLYLSKDRGRS